MNGAHNKAGMAVPPTVYVLGALISLLVVVLFLVVPLALKRRKKPAAPTHSASLLRAFPQGLPGNAVLPNIQRFLKGMPKTALHTHLEGSLEPAMAFSLAQKHNMLPMKIPKAGGGSVTVNTLKELETVYQFDDLQSFLNVYNTLATTLKTKEDFVALAAAYGEVCIDQDILHAETFFDPQTHTARGIPFAVVADGLNEGFDTARKRGISLNIVCSILRDHPVGSSADAANMNAAKAGSNPTAWTTVKEAVQYNASIASPAVGAGGRNPEYRIVGIGLDNAERGFPPSLFTKVYAYAEQNGMYAVAHAGEEGSADYIWQAINSLHVIRVDHAVRSAEDASLVSFLATPQTYPQILRWYNGAPHKLAETVCPTSNWKLGVFADPTRTNIVELLDMGMLVTVNSDDPAYLGGYVYENYLFLWRVLQPGVAKARPINLADIYRLAYNGFLGSVINESRRLQYLAELNNYFLVAPGTLYREITAK